jgi:hypothetical protein
MSEKVETVAEALPALRTRVRRLDALLAADEQGLATWWAMLARAIQDLAADPVFRGGLGETTPATDRKPVPPE